MNSLDLVKLYIIFSSFLFFFSVPPHKAVITDESGQEKASVVGPYTEGAELRLRCLVYGGKL